MRLDTTRVKPRTQWNSEAAGWRSARHHDQPRAVGSRNSTLVGVGERGTVKLDTTRVKARTQWNSGAGGGRSARHHDQPRAASSARLRAHSPNVPRNGKAVWANSHTGLWPTV